jgi:hypothetical protein
MSRNASAGVDEGDSEIGTRQTDKAALEAATDRPEIHRGDLMSGVIDHAHAFHLVRAIQQGGCEAHALGDVESETPEIDDVTTATESRRSFEQHRFVPESAEPIRQRWPGHPRAVDRDSHRLPLLLIGNAPQCSPLSPVTVLTSNYFD